MRMSSWESNKDAPCAALDDRRDLEQLKPDLHHGALCEVGPGKHFPDEGKQNEGCCVQEEPEEVSAKAVATGSS